MGREDLIACFQDTFERSNSGILKQRTERAIRSNHVYKEGFVSSVQFRNERAHIEVYSGTTFEIAKKYRNYGRIAVLNFANPEIPGGGVWKGAMAQEECLCRSSNLYACISNENVFEDYYGYHRGLKNHFFTDRLIYTKDVTVFKSDDVVPQLLPEEEWFDVDVITCAAPYLGKRKYTNGAALLDLFKSRVKNIFEAARDNKVDYIILGAFGCGAFKNPPRIVAEAFLQAIMDNDYFDDFKQIIFAIKPTGENCPNLIEFSGLFDGYIQYAGLGCTLLLEPWDRRNCKFDRIYRFCRYPALPTESRFSNNSRFQSWQTDNMYFGKQFSILGDSISTLVGYNPRGYKVFYAGENAIKSGVTTMQDAWWDKVIAYFGGELLVNNSWSGSRVTKLKDSERLFPSGCSDERTAALHINDVKPNVILVYLGTNDWANGVPILKHWDNGEDYENCPETMLFSNEECFDVAYEAMLTKLRKNYPCAEIWCCTLCETYISKKTDFKFPHTYAGTHIEEYNKIIRDIAGRNGCRLIDLYSYRMAYDSVDGSHPTNSGMDTIATLVIREMRGSDEETFLDCTDGNHNYIVTEQYTGGTKYVCTKCAKVMHTTTLLTSVDEETTVLVDNNESDDSEYVMLDSDITAVLYSDILRLTIESSGKTVEFQKDVVEVGRAKTCDLLLEEKYVARSQATFLYERNMWFLRDNFTTNGTWLNGTKIQSGKKYQLAANDEINFAMAEKVVFYKQESVEQSNDNMEKKAIELLEAGMEVFAKSEYKDEVAWKLIMVALSDAPLYFPVEIDLEAMLGSIDPIKLKAGDTLQPTKDVKMRILTITSEAGVEFTPMFTSNIEANKGSSTSIIRFYPQDYLPKLVQMDKPVIVNPFSENRFILSQQMITEVILPLVENKTKPQTDVVEKTADKYIGKTIAGKYEVMKLLRRGGIYATYLVRDLCINKAWAMKVCDKKNRSYSPKIRELILTEPHMMMKLDHPAIPKVVDIIEDEDSIFIVRDYIEGKTLETIVSMQGAQPADKVIEWGKQICNVLGYLHLQNPPLIYRDMNPANVMLKADGIIKLIDFGIMRVYKQNQNYDTSCLGTKGYAAPEQYSGCRQTDARTDIFGLGMTMYHLVTGVDPKQPPYEVKPICEINPLLPKGLEYIISKCIELEPDNRYQNVNELMQDLNDYMNLPKFKGRFKKLLFGRKGFKAKVNSKVKKIYSSVDSEYRDKLFYGDEWSAQSILLGLASDVFGKISDANIELCFQIYLQTWIRARGGVELRFSTPSYIRQALCERFSNVNPNIVSKCVTYSLCEIYRHEPELKKRIEDIENSSI